jgi:metal-responsive CopG/Arc/MetJ family transcriptional regulator
MASSVKTAISMQKELFDAVNKLAEELHISRSKFFVMAVQDYIQRNESKDLLLKINKAFSDYPDSDEIKLHNKMKSKQRENLEKESW